MHHRVFGGEIPQRHEEALHVVDEDVHDADFSNAGPDAQNNRHSDPGRDFDCGEEQRVVADRFIPRVPMIRIHGIKLGHIARFATEELHDLHAGHALLDVGIDARDTHADFAEGLADLQPKDHRRNGEHRHNGESPGRKFRR